MCREVAPRAFCVHKVEKYVKIHGDVRKDSLKSWELKEVSCNWQPGEGRDSTGNF